MTNNTITVMKKELARFFGDRRLVITTLLLPGIMIYVVYSFLGSAMMKSILPEEAYVAKAYVVDMPESLREELRELKVDWQPADREQLTQMRQEIQDKQADGSGSGKLSGAEWETGAQRGDLLQFRGDGIHSFLQ